MHKLRIYLTAICLISLSFFSRAQTNERSGLRISLITCTPGEELYSIFGHSALRVVDSVSLTDLVYNYGTFNFDDEGFYLKFIRGKLLYYISLENFSDFAYMYKSENRGITEQVLDLTEEEKTDLRSFLNENLKEENRYYRYDFFFDNCTTRLRDLIRAYKRPRPHFETVMPENTRFREAIHMYLDRGRQYWSKLGIDILLGAPTDAIMTAEQQQFLPDNLMWSLDSTRNTSLVKNKQVIVSTIPVQESGFRFTPGIFFSFLLCMIILLSLYKHPKAASLLNRLDGLFFFLTGSLGCILLFMWFGTDHSMTKNNYNLLWAWPTHAVMAFLTGSKKKWVRTYWLLTAAGLTLLLISWYFLPQQMNQALIPFVLMLIYRSSVKYVKNK